MVNPKVVDLSHWNVVTDMRAMKAGGIVGVIHKATQGLHYIDPAYATRRAMAQEAGLLWGAYHFGTGDDPVEQAGFFLRVVQPTASTLVALDWEHTGGKDMPVLGMLTFLRAVEARLSRKAVLYSGMPMFRGVQLSAIDAAYLSDHRYWHAQYGPTLRLPPYWGKPWLWQFTDGEHNTQDVQIRGVKGGVDVNSFIGTDKELGEQWGAKPVRVVPVSKSWLASVWEWIVNLWRKRYV